MVGLEELSSLDFILWRRTGKLAAQVSGCNQSTMSRRLGRCLQTFDLQMVRREGEWELPSSALLQMERELHQRCRLAGQRALRLEAFPGAGRLLVHPLLAGWIGGSFDHIGVDRPLQLLRERVIDAWISDAIEDLPAAAERTDLVVMPLWRNPVQLHASAGHPLARERGLTDADLRDFPSLDIPAQGYRRSRALFHARGLGNIRVNNCSCKWSRYEQACWEGQTADQHTLVLSTPLNRLSSGQLVRLDLDPVFANGGALICHRDLADQSAINLLLASLRSRLAGLKATMPELELL